jgi:hypothetical protein
MTLKSLKKAVLIHLHQYKVSLFLLFIVYCIETCADETSYQLAKNKINDTMLTNTIPPDIFDYYSIIISDTKLNLTLSEQLQLYDDILDRQRTDVSLEDIHSLTLAKIRSIKNILCKYIVTEKYTDPKTTKEIQHQTNYTFAFDGNKYYLESIYDQTGDN